MITGGSTRAGGPSTAATGAGVRGVRRLGLCFHEAGHAVAGVLAGGELTDSIVTGLPVTIAAAAVGTEAPLGVTRFADMATSRQPAVALAGPWAEAYWRCGRRPPTARQLDAVLAGGGHQDCTAIRAAGASTADLSGEVSVLLQRCWGSVATVAERLQRSGYVDHRAVCAALSIPATGNAHHLTLIRGGAVPGTFTVSAPRTG